MNTISFLLTTALVLVGPFSAFGDVLIEPENVILTKGYTAALHQSMSVYVVSSAHIETPKDLIWPVNLIGEFRNSVGFSLAQFQSNWAYKEYFHGGCDLVAEKGSDVVAPISGKVEAGYYTYAFVEGGGGYLKKYWIPLSEAAGKEVNADYFEIAIVTDKGFRFELHHMDPKTLTAELKNLVLQKQEVQAGQKIGTVKEFPYQILNHTYNHIHYNVIAPDGRRINCEWVSQRLQDNQPPEIGAVFADYGSRIQSLKAGERLAEVPSEIIVQASDKKSGGFFPQQPVKVQIYFANGLTTKWDFAFAIQDSLGLPPKVEDVYRFSFVDTDGVTHATVGDADQANMFFRLKVPPQASGKFMVLVEDFAGNRALFSGELPDRSI